MLQYCILTSLFFRLLGPEGEKFLVGRKIGYLWFVGCKVLPKFCFCNLIKIGPNSIYKRQRQLEYLLLSSVPSADFQFAETERNATLQFTTNMTVTSSRNIETSTQSLKSVDFLHGVQEIEMTNNDSPNFSCEVTMLQTFSSLQQSEV